MSNFGRIFLAGGSRGVGMEVAQWLRRNGLDVTALLRSPQSQPTLEAMGIMTVSGDALEPEQVEQAMRSTPIDAVISTIGGMPQEGQRSDYRGNRNLIDAAVKAGVRKFVLVTSIGSGESAVALPPQVLETLGPVLAEKHQAEQHLIASGLTYVIVRPGGLKSEPATGNAVLTPDPKIAGSINRADVADLVCRCLLSEQANQRILSAVDRSLVYGQPNYEVFVPE